MVHVLNLRPLILSKDNVENDQDFNFSYWSDVGKAIEDGGGWYQN